MIKQISPSNDSQGVTLYAPTSASSQLAFPIIATSSGCLMISNGLDLPPYDSIVLGYTGNFVSSCQYYIGGTGGTLVATLTITYNGNNVSSVVRT